MPKMKDVVWFIEDFKTNKSPVTLDYHFLKLE